MDINELKNYNIRSYLIENGNSNQKSVVDEILKLKLPTSSLFFKTYSLKKTKKNVDLSYIVDFEGDPFFMVGFLADNKIIQIYIKDIKNRISLILHIFKILEIFHKSKYVAFSFSKYEYNQLIKSYSHLEKVYRDIKDFNFIRNMLIVDLQESPYESLLEALFKIGIERSCDILFRNSGLLVKLQKYGEYKLILKHNKNCLEMENLILEKRWMKKYKL